MNKTRLLVILVLLTACVGHQPAVVRVATDATFEPFHYFDNEGELSGFDIELAREVAVQAGLKAEFIVLPYDELFSGLLEGSHDMVAATTGITQERKKSYLFSEPYFETCQIAVVRTGAREPTVVRDLIGLKIGASGQGTSARAMKLIDGIQISTAEGENIRMLLEHSIDAWIVDEFDAVNAVRSSDGKLRALSDGISTEKYGFVFAGDNRFLQEKINAGLDQVIESGIDIDLLQLHGMQRGPEWPVKCVE